MNEEQQRESEARKAVSLPEDSLEEMIDVEDWVKGKKGPKKAKSYRIRIDKDKFVVTVHEMKGREILGLDGKTPEKYLLSEKFRGGRVEPIQPDQVVEFHLGEVERFQTLAKDPTEGSDYAQAVPAVGGR
jgi:hypothetical protein